MGTIFNEDSIRIDSYVCEEQQECMYVCHTSSNKVQIVCNNDNDSVYRDVQVDSLKTVLATEKLLVLDTHSNLISLHALEGGGEY